MPASSHMFDHLYSMLLSSTQPLPAEAKSPGNALLLLVALVSDHLYVRRMIGMVSSRYGVKHYDQTNDILTSPNVNPFPSLSPTMESARITTSILRASEAWYEEFHSVCPKAYLALFYYLKLRLSFPELQSLPELAGYGSPRRKESANESGTLVVSDESLRLAWLILDHVDFRNLGMESRLAIWTPVVLFHAALVVWQRVRITSSQSIGSLKMLRPFIHELEQVPWPCSEEMMTTLRRLISDAGELL